MLVKAPKTDRHRRSLPQTQVAKVTKKGVVKGRILKTEKKIDFEERRVPIYDGFRD